MRDVIEACLAALPESLLFGKTLPSSGADSTPTSDAAHIPWFGLLHCD